MLEVGRRSGHSTQSDRVRRSIAEAKDDRAAEAGRKIRVSVHEVPVRDEVARQMERGPQCDREGARSEHSARRCTGCHVQGGDHCRSRPDRHRPTGKARILSGFARGAVLDHLDPGKLHSGRAQEMSLRSTTGTRQCVAHLARAVVAAPA